jgi:hypothetical protein
MSETQNSPPSSDAGPASADRACDGSSVPAGSADGEAFGMDEGSDLGGHTLLSRPPAPRGRRSLFRR